jgi:phage gpG-like protein
MSRWPRTVREALRDPRVLRAISMAGVSWMSRHIDEGEGRGKDGSVVAYKPLKTMTGNYWTARPPKGVPISGTRTRTVRVMRKRKDKNGNTVEVQGTKVVTEYRISQTSYRAGGQPLRDTGSLYRSLASDAARGGQNIVLTMRGNRYGLFHDRGFKTKGPIHFIPLTKRGRRGHGTGNDPEAEGLVRGKDYLLIGSKKRPKGVTVPSRPFILPTRQDLRDLGKSIAFGLRQILKGK